MNNNNITIGIDACDGTYFVARVNNHSGRPDIKALIRFDADHFNGHHLLEGNQIIISCPDNQTTLKQIQLHDSENSQLKIQFELENIFVENADSFLFDIIPTKLDNYYLGLIIRKELTQQMITPFVKQNGDVSFSTGGVMRAAALARGFLTFCQQSGGELGAIIDFSSQSASIAFYYKQQIIDLTYLPLNETYHQNNNSFQNLIIELKTLLNFKLAALLEKGISVPLSKLFLIGEHLSESHIQSLEENLKIEIAFPEIHTGFITDQTSSHEIPLDRYLVALGLTVI